MADSDPSARWTLDYDGRRLELETHSAGLATVTRLFVDGEQVDEQKAKSDRAELSGGGVTVRVRLTWLGGVRELIALLPAADGERPKELAFAPPRGSRAEKLEALARERPALYASRHVAIAAGQILVGLLGLGALLGLLLPRIPFPSIEGPEIDLPDLPLPHIDLPDITLPGWIRAFLSTTKFWFPIVIAIGIALNELEKRRKRQQNAEEQARREPSATGARERDDADG